MQSTKSKVHTEEVYFSLSKWALIWTARTTCLLDFFCLDYRVWASSLISLTAAQPKPWPPLFCRISAESPTKPNGVYLFRLHQIGILLLALLTVLTPLSIRQCAVKEHVPACSLASWQQRALPLANPSHRLLFTNCMSMLHLLYNSATLHGQVCLLMHNAKPELDLQEFAYLQLCSWNPTMHAHLVVGVWLMINTMGKIRSKRN